jgi:hypothetical protein
MELRTKEVCWHASYEHDICHPVLSSDGRALAFTVLDREQRTLEVWDTGQGKRLARMKLSLDWTTYRFLPNSNVLAAVDAPCGLVFFGFPSSKRRGTIAYPTITAFEFCRAGRSLAISRGKNAIDIFSLDRARLGQKGARNRESRDAVQAARQADLSRWYEALAGTDARAARESMKALESTGDRGVEFLETRPTRQTVGEDQILRLVRELASDEFSVRQQAQRSLGALARTAK